MSYWSDKNVLITGGTGFLGGHLLQLLKTKSPKNISVIGIEDGNLMDYKQAYSMLKGADVVIHLAAKVAGIGYNKTHPAEMFEENMLMGVNVIRACKQASVKKLCFIGTICSYPKFTKVPFRESDLWNGYPEETNAPYGIAKKALLVMLQAYKDQYGLNGIYLMPVNMYGPGNNFKDESSHVIPALIKRFDNAKSEKKEYVEIWGSGKATREFLYVKDSIRGIVAACEKYNKADPVNLGNGREVSISKLANIIKKLTGYKGVIVWDKSMPDGQPRRCVDTTKAKAEFGFTSTTPLEDGLKQTIKWYKNHRDQ